MGFLINVKLWIGKKRIGNDFFLKSSQLFGTLFLYLLSKSPFFFTVNIDYYFLKCYTDFFIGYLFVVINDSKLVL